MMAQTLSDMYRTLLESGDHRTNRWPLVQSPVPSLCFIALYIVFVKTAPYHFRNRRPINLKPTLVLYNAGMVLFSAYMAKEFFLSAYLANFSLICQPVIATNELLPMRLANVFWWFYISKAIEGLDTVFIIMSKKDRQLTFLHAFHHTSMVFNQWMAIKYFPGGHGFLLGLLNSVVHVIMYTYYGLACFPALNKYLWWKKYLTILQLGQFVAVVAHIAVGLSKGCLTPTWPCYYVTAYSAVLIVLFSNFYSNAYNIKQATSKALLQIGKHESPKKLS